MPTQTQPAELSDIVGAVRRHWFLVVVISLLGLALGLLAIFVIPVKYTSTASVAVNPMNANPLGASSDSAKAVNMATEEQLARSRRVAAAAVFRISPQHTLDVQTVMDGTTVQTPQDSMVLDIEFSAPTARQAADVANAVAESYLAVRRSDATRQFDLMQTRTQEQIDRMPRSKVKPDEVASTDPKQRVQGVQADALGAMLVELASIDLTPGRFVSRAVEASDPSTPGMKPLGLAGLFLGLIVAIPIALTRKDEETRISSVEGLAVTEHQLVLDGTQDDDREETWDLAAFMLKIPKRANRGRTIMVDGEPAGGRLAAGQELVDALQRRGEAARFVDAGAVDGHVIGRGWPTERERRAWNGEVVIVDTTKLASDAHRVAVAENADAVILARSTADDARTMRRLVGLLDSKGANVALTALFPSRPEFTALTQ